MSHLNESCRARMSHFYYEWVMSHMNATWLIWMSSVSYEWAMSYGLATISRLLKITGLFYKRALLKRLYSAIETHNFKEPTNHCRPMLWRSRVSCANETYKRDNILQKRPIILRSLLIVATPYRKESCLMNGSCLIWMSHFAHEWVKSQMNEPCRIWTAHMNEACRVRMSHDSYEWVMSHMNELRRIWMSHVAYEWVMSHMNVTWLIWMS